MNAFARYKPLLHQLPNALSGHAWTVGASFLPPEGKPSPSTYWEHWFIDPSIGRVGIHGAVHEQEGSKDLAIIVHGLGGTPDSNYVVQAAYDLSKLGFSTLRLGLRGTSGKGGDFYYAASTEDIHQAISNDLFSSYERIILVGYSLGGHIILSTAVEQLDPRVKGLVSICAPLDLVKSAVYIERPSKWPYRQYMLYNMRRMYRDIAANGNSVVSSEQFARIRSLRSWDNVITSKRWGYQGADDYYQRASIAPHLKDLKVKSIFLYTSDDPMVVAEGVEPYLDSNALNFLPFRIEGGGHVYLPSEIDLGAPNTPKSLFPQALSLLDLL